MLWLQPRRIRSLTKKTTGPTGKTLRIHSWVVGLQAVIVVRTIELIAGVICLIALFLFTDQAFFGSGPRTLPYTVGSAIFVGASFEFIFGYFYVASAISFVASLWSNRVLFTVVVSMTFAIYATWVSSSIYRRFPWELALAVVL